MSLVEQVVGMMTAVAKGRAVTDVFETWTHNAEAYGGSRPKWLTVTFAQLVQERLRRLIGRWKATPYGSFLELTWPPESASST